MVAILTRGAAIDMAESQLLGGQLMMEQYFSVAGAAGHVISTLFRTQIGVKRVG